MRTMVGGISMLASIAAAGAAHASSPPCFQASLRGVLFSSVTGAFTSPVKLSVRSTTRQGALLLFGSYRCAHDTDHPHRCIGTGTDGTIYGSIASVSPLGTIYSLQLSGRHAAAVSIKCDLETAPAFTRAEGCIAGLIGNYTCHDARVETDHGSFGVVGTCGQCPP
jgi:hypothetical protein